MQNQWNRNLVKLTVHFGLAAAFSLFLSAPVLAAEAAEAAAQTASDDTAEGTEHPHAHGQHDETFEEKAPREKARYPTTPQLPHSV